jgi:hypothetical protein
LETKKEGEDMKRGVLMIIAVLMLAGCGHSLAKSEFLQHDTMYKDWDHMTFSWFGYHNPSQKDAQETTEQGWWGIDVPYVPGQ